MLATLFKDERCQQLPAYSILEKMYLDRIIRRSELHEFEALMQTHQKVTPHLSVFRKNEVGSINRRIDLAAWLVIYSLMFFLFRVTKHSANGVDVSLHK